MQSQTLHAILIITLIAGAVTPVMLVLQYMHGGLMEWNDVPGTM